MPSLPTIRASNAAFRHITSPGSIPVAVFVGGTAGIGEALARKFAEHTKGNADIIIVGRNKKAGEDILASLPLPPNSSSSPPKRDFIQCDTSLISNVSNATSSILQTYPRINYLILSTGIATLAGRTETKEGIDNKLALHYYSRWKWIGDLAPALAKAKSASGSESPQEGAVMSVLGAGYGGAIDTEDFGLVKNYSTSNAALAAPTYNDLMMESYATKYPTIPFIHAHPGFVRTQGVAKSDSWLLRYSSFLITTLARPLTVSPEECAEWMWNAMYHTATRAGAWRTGFKGEDLGQKRYFGDEVQREKLWEHTEEIVGKAVAQA